MAVQFDDKLALIWSEADYPREFRIECLSGSRIVNESLQPSRPLVTLPDCRGARDIVIEGGSKGAGMHFLRNPGTITLLERTPFR
ncbi:MAG: hypothetical protein ABI231_10875 [Candidatus Tumulicola sp.]